MVPPGVTLCCWGLWLSCWGLWIGFGPPGGMLSCKGLWIGLGPPGVMLSCWDLWIRFGPSGDTVMNRIWTSGWGSIVSKTWCGLLVKYIRLACHYQKREHDEEKHRRWDNIGWRTSSHDDVEKDRWCGWRYWDRSKKHANI